MSVPARRRAAHAIAALAAACAWCAASPSAQTEKASPHAAGADSFDELYAKGKRLNDSMKTLTKDSMGLCMAPDGAAQGPVQISATQAKASGN